MTISNLKQLYKFQGGVLSQIETRIMGEASVALTVNGEHWMTFMCTPLQLEALAVGFLFNEKVIEHKSEVIDMHICEDGDNVDVWLTHDVEQPAQWRRTSGCMGGASTVDLLMNGNASYSLYHANRNHLTLTSNQVTDLTSRLLESQDIYRMSGGVHASALSNGENLLVVTEDIGRHNTLDKIAGICLLEDIWPEERILLTTGRISSEMLQKAARLEANVVISRTAPSSLAIDMAEKSGITLIGYSRRDSFNIYSHPQYIKE